MPDPRNRLKEVINNPGSSAEEKAAAWKEIEAIDSSEAVLEPQGAGTNESEADPITSGFTKAFVMMAMCDEAQTRAGSPGFDYGDEEGELLCKAWHEGYRRAKAGHSLFRRLFERELTLHDRTVLGLD
jgi:hypothetical protein